MAQISRPFQIALVAVVLLGGVWLFALKGGTSSDKTSASAPAGSAPAPAPASRSSSSESSPSATDGGPTAPGVAGLKRATDKAHGAVTTSQQNAQQLEQKSKEAASNSADSGGTSAPTTSKSSSQATATSTPAPSSPAASSHKATKTVRVTASKQRVVESELRDGKVVVLLFWDRKGADDVSVHGVVQGLAGGGVAVHSSPPREVALYGTVTRGVQIYGTPTVLVIGRSRKARVVTGLTDAYSLEQAISEARRSRSH